MSTLTLTKEETDKLDKLIHDIGVAMIVTKSPDGSLHSRPMACPKHSFDGNLYFFTAEESLKAHEVEFDSQVNIALAEPKTERYVSMSGRASVVKDAVRAREMWNPLMKGWFPDGPDDRSLALLKVEIEHAEYWDAKSSRMLVLFSLAKASLGGKAPTHLGDHKNLG
ncbi:MAG TPA: pyridoxamine 5'-phosphate oxidase family protein [Opitutaceae bacterium]|jgi:general stress protein 26|nr:pyridoxamine 5'-phosphate oxidase family protein [Opitutaceae bacterium]